VRGRVGPGRLGVVGLGVVDRGRLGRIPRRLIQPCRVIRSRRRWRRPVVRPVVVPVLGLDPAGRRFPLVPLAIVVHPPRRVVVPVLALDPAGRRFPLVPLAVVVHPPRAHARLPHRAQRQRQVPKSSSGLPPESAPGTYYSLGVTDPLSGRRDPFAGLVETGVLSMEEFEHGERSYRPRCRRRGGLSSQRGVARSSRATASLSSPRPPPTRHDQSQPPSTKPAADPRDHCPSGSGTRHKAEPGR
jgi:hypothetical protein